jgi:DNA polymerase-3 subunit epsilon
MRQIILDTETTGLSVESGHRVIEIGMVEIIDRRLTGNDFQAYLNPERKIDPASIPIHGLTDEFIADKPLFKDIVTEFLSFIDDSEVIMHNAPFDSSFINNEFDLTGIDQRLEDICQITDSLTLARKKHPGQRNSLDALCSRYEVNTSSRELHGALIDAKLLANVYLLMTGGQVGFFGASNQKEQNKDIKSDFDFSNRKKIVVDLDESEIKAHQDYLKKLSKVSKKDLNW